MPQQGPVLGPSALPRKFGVPGFDTSYPACPIGAPAVISPGPMGPPQKTGTNPNPLPQASSLLVNLSDTILLHPLTLETEAIAMAPCFFSGRFLCFLTQFNLPPLFPCHPSSLSTRPSMHSGHLPHQLSPRSPLPFPLLVHTTVHTHIRLHTH